MHHLGAVSGGAVEECHGWSTSAPGLGAHAEQALELGRRHGAYGGPAASSIGSVDALGPGAGGREAALTGAGGGCADVKS